ncbi:hypothetical protein JWG39_15765, partial [Desulforhopalus vacuolatus]|nr:hypothetical protein [Desulforhopalus vacuolatus]
SHPICILLLKNHIILFGFVLNSQPMVRKSISGRFLAPTGNSCVYIDCNMVRAGVVAHPSEWPFCGYNEIQMPKRKSVLIDYQKLAKLTGFASYSTFRETHKELVSESVTNRTCGRQPGWSESVAVGSRSFVETIHSKLGFRGKGRKVLEHDIGFQLPTS